MLTCHACGSILVSDGENWMCASFVANAKLHTILTQRSDNYINAMRNPLQIPDKRIGIQRKDSALAVGA
jgi:hypothetical protein